MEYASNLLQQSPGQFTTMITLKEQIVGIFTQICVVLCMCVFLSVW